MTILKQTPAKAGRPLRNIDQEIVAAEARLRQLKDKKRDDERKELERNQRAILGLLHDASLDRIAVNAWQAALPAIVKLLQTNHAGGKPVPPATALAAPDSSAKPPPTARHDHGSSTLA